MEKYVKLQDVYDLLNKMTREPRYQHEDEDYYSGVAQVADKLVGVPTIELEGSKVGERLKSPCSEKDGLEYKKQVKGTWKYYSSTMMECSACQRHVPNHRYKFCPHCGAKMEKEN